MAGAAAGVLLAVVEAAAVITQYWFVLPTAWAVRAFALGAIGLDALLGGAAGLLSWLLPTRLLPLPLALVLGFVVWGQSRNFADELGPLAAPRFAAPAALVTGALLALLAGRLAPKLPPGTRVRPAFAGALAILVVAALVPPSLPAATGRGPNVLVIVVDTLRADRLGLGGSARVRSPHVDRLSRAGTTFRRAVTASNLTTASFASILTSTYVADHGVDYFTRVLPEDYETFPELLAARGYATFGFSSSYPAHLAYHNFDQGLGHKDDASAPPLCRVCPPTDGIERLGFFLAWESLGVRLLPRGHVTETREADRTTRAVLEHMGRMDAGPWLGLVHYFDPHTPYNPPYYYLRYEGGPGGMTKGNLDELFARTGRTKPDILRRPVDVRDPQFLEDSYDGEVAFTDHHVGLLLAEIRRRREVEHTFVVLTADHGESLFEHQLALGHARLYEEVMTVPLVVAGPGVLADRIAPALVRTVDIYPTVVELTGGRPAAGLRGTSLVPTLLRGEGAGAPTAVAAGSGDDITALLRGDDKLIRSGGTRLELYDLALDPGEEENLAERRPELRDELAAEMDRHASRSTAPAPDAEEHEETLRTLGYVD